MKVSPLIAFICSTSFLHFTGSHPTPTTDSDHRQTTLNSNVPLEFPQYNQNYTFVDNSSIRQNLASHSKNDTEVDDLLLDENVKATLQSLSTIKNPLLSNPVPNPSEKDEDISFKNDTEWIENGENTEDTRIIIKEIVHEDSSYEERIPLFGGQVAAILAGIFLLLSIVAYGALLSWRRILEMKYGSREMLVNEEDFMDPVDDLKHFSI